MTKHKTSLPSRLSAALLALVLVMTLAPAARAVDTCPESSNGEHLVKKWETYVEATCQKEGMDRGVCERCGQTVYEEIKKDYDNHEANYTDEGNGYHSAVCPFHPDERIPLEAHRYTASGVCTKCGAIDYSSVSMNLPENLTIPVAVGSADAKLSVGEVKLLLGTANVTDDYTIYYNWYYDGSPVATSAEYTLPVSVTGEKGIYRYTLFVSAVPKNSLRQNVSSSCNVTVQVEDLLTASAVISQDESSFYLGDPDSWSSESVYEQIYTAVQDICPRTEEPDYVVFHTLPNSTVGKLDVRTSVNYYFEDGTRRNTLDDVKFTVQTGAGATTGDYTVGFTAYDTAGDDYAGVLTITVQQYAGDMDVVLATSANTPLTLTADVFENFWNKTYPNGALDSISFKALPRTTEGTLYVDYISSSLPGTRATIKDNFYLDPGRSSYGIDAVTFVPGVKQTDYITLDFRAEGIKNNGNNGTLTGTIYIFIHAGGSADIAVTAVSSGTALSSESFRKAYQSATGGTGSSFYIQLLEVPARGALYVGRTANRTGTLLTTRNVAGYPLSYGDLSSITYIPAAGVLSESIRYVACSVQGKPLYTGKITFTVSGSTATTPTTPTNPTNPTNPSTTALLLNVDSPATGVKLSAKEFEDLLGTGAPKLVSVLFGTTATTYGTFYYNRTSTSAGTLMIPNNTSFSVVTTNPPIGALSLDNLTFVPVAGVSGVVAIPFTAIDALNNRYTGIMRVTVVSTGTTNPGTTTPTIPTNPSTPTTPTTQPKKTFSDVPVTSGYYQYITDLTTSGALSGYPDGTFRPAEAVTLGAALKMIMIAANPTEYSNIEPLPNSHWASGYLDRAIKDNLLPAGLNQGLDRRVSRYTIAEIAARAMKLAPVENAAYSPFSDMPLSHSSAKYVMALYNIGVYTGSVDSTTGQLVFLGENAIIREQFAAVIWRVQNYVRNSAAGDVG